MKLNGLFASIIITLFVYGCANQMSPSGGEVDKIPPEVIEVYPNNGTTNFDDSSIEIGFSEYVDRRSVSDAVFISPVIDGEVEYSWSGTSLEIEFEEQLKPNTTYTVTIGTEVKDINNGNKMRFPYTLVFSTGDKIDHGQVYGTVFDPNYEGVLIFAYRDGDSVYNPTVTKPDYISQVGENGVFKLLGISSGKYKIVAVKDALKNYLYNVGDDWFGLPYKEIEFTKTDTVFSDLNFQLSIEDTIAPGISQVTMTDRHHFLIEFSEFIDSSKITTDNFYIFDSTDNKRIDAKYLFKGKANKQQLFLAIKDTLIEENENYLIAANIPDKFSNLSDPQSVELTVNTSPDTLLAKVKSVETLFTGNEVDYIDPWIKIFFDDGIDVNNLKNGIAILDKDSNNIKFDYFVYDDAAIKIKPEKLKPKSEYTLNVNQNYFEDIAGNKLDTLYRIKFRTINDLRFSGALGFANISDINHSSDYYVVLQDVEKKDQKYQSMITDDLTFSFERVVPGLYQIWFYEDGDSSQTYSYGNIYPFKESERFGYFADTLNLRARWPVADINLKLEN